ncbi:MAG TPA: hybrid sensor histidine kinase/response regulator [Polyangiaceae bacterium]|jgi:signal transduction histidine kinase|nr:hybrid sensor histidine kinase/response regulator [Polyangiaceae bacterium]
MKTIVARSGADASTQTTGARILVVEKDSDLSDYLVGILSRRWSVVVLTSCAEARLALRREHFDLLVSGRMTPSSDRLGLLQVLRADTTLHRMPTILLSSRTTQEADIGAFAEEADDYLVAPFSPREAEARVEAQLRLAFQARALAENGTRDDLFAVVGHELRTPLAAISLWSGAVRSGKVPPADLGRAFDAITASAESLSRMIDDLLDLSRLRSRKIVISPVRSLVMEAVRAAVDALTPTANGLGVRIDVDMQADLGSALLDATRLRQVLWNLLSNAIKFSPKGSAVVLRVSKSAGFLEMKVSDAGVGIAAEFLPHVFEPFEQEAAGDNKRGSGLGIGLAVTKRLIELQGGTIEAQSEGRGLGSTFRVRLPWIAPSDGDSTDGLASDKPPRCAVPQRLA